MRVTLSRLRTALFETNGAEIAPQFDQLGYTLGYLGVRLTSVTPREILRRIRSLILILAFIVAMSLSSFYGAVLTGYIKPIKVSGWGQIIQVEGTIPGRSLSGPDQIIWNGDPPVDTLASFKGWSRLLVSVADIHNQKVSPSDQKKAQEQATEFNSPDPAVRAHAIAEAKKITIAAVKKFYLRVLVIAVIINMIIFELTVRLWLKRLFATRRAWPILAISLLCTVSVLAANVTVGATSTVHALKGVNNLLELIGIPADNLTPIPVGPDLPDVEVAGLTDSTGTGQGGPPLTNPTPEDILCKRGSDSFVSLVAGSLGMKSENFGCGDASIREGILGPQTFHPKNQPAVTLPAQLGRLRKATNVKLIFEREGANDALWSQQTGLCYGAVRCDFDKSKIDRALDAYQVFLDKFYQQLAELPSHPTIVALTYGRVFDNNLPLCFDTNPGFTILNGKPKPIPGLTRGDEKNGDGKINYLNGFFDRLNAIRAQKATKYHFLVARPPDDHALCSAQPYVQGIISSSRFHPNDLGRRADAQAVLAALYQAQLKAQPLAAVPAPRTPSDRALVPAS